MNCCNNKFKCIKNIYINKINREVKVNYLKKN